MGLSNADNRARRKKQAQHGGEIEAGVAFERPRDRLAERAFFEQGGEKDASAGGQKMRLDIEIGAQDQRVFAALERRDLRLSIALMRAPDRQDGAF